MSKTKKTQQAEKQQQTTVKPQNKVSLPEVVTLKVTPNAVNYIFKLLRSRPYEEVELLIRDLQNQLITQSSPVESEDDSEKDS